MRLNQGPGLSLRILKPCLTNRGQRTGRDHFLDKWSEVLHYGPNNPVIAAGLAKQTIKFSKNERLTAAAVTIYLNLLKSVNSAEDFQAIQMYVKNSFNYETANSHQRKIMRKALEKASNRLGLHSHDSINPNPGL